MSLVNTHVPELAGSDTAICLANLDRLAIRQDRLSESMIALLSELADAIIHDGEGDPDTVDSILLSLQTMNDGGDLLPENTEVAPVNRETVSHLHASLGIPARLLLYRLVEERLTRPAAVVTTSTNTAEGTRGRIAYMAGTFADKAYARLSTCVPGARAVTAASFVDACEEVHNGLCPYAILPLENTQSGKLTAFSSLIVRYNLTILAICDLENGAAPGQITRFALLGAADGENTTPLILPPPLYLELLHTTPTPSLAHLLQAATACGLTLRRTDTLPHSDPQEAAPLPICCVFHAAEADLVTFRRFLSLEASEDILMGTYGQV